VIAHRGASADFPENTMAAFDAAVRHPIDGIETDIQPAADGSLVLFHDRTLGKLGAPRRRVTGMSLKTLKNLDAGGWFDQKFSGEQLVTLNELLDRHGGTVPLMIEIKQRGGQPSAAKHLALAQKVAELLLERDLASRAFMLCFGLDVLLACHNTFPRLNYVWSLKQPTDRTDQLAGRIHPLAALCCSQRTINADWVAWVHEQGKPVWTFTVNDPDTADRVMAAGVDGMISDRPGWLCRYVAAHFGGE
jgi:glycerophosphoryl diester phosphodiesterase